MNRMEKYTKESIHCYREGWGGEKKRLNVYSETQLGAFGTEIASQELFDMVVLEGFPPRTMEKLITDTHF